MSTYTLLIQINALPPREADAPIKKSNWPPVPLICLTPELSAATCPYKSTATQLLIDTILSICAITLGRFTYSSGYAATPGLLSNHSYSALEPMAHPNTPFPGSSFFCLFVNFPAKYICRYASEQSSVCIPKSFKSDFAIISPSAFGILPIPSCNVAPSTICGIRYLAICLSISVGSSASILTKGSCSPSTI